MSVTFLHTADWQLGKPFAGVDDPDKRALLRRERIAVLERISTTARDHEAAFIVVAGDVFDSPAATKDTVSAACAAIGAMAMPVFVIPGNHDHGGPGSVWEQPFFLREMEKLAPNLTVCLEPKPIELDRAILLPCPLLRRRESSDTTAWLHSLEALPDKPRIVLAHGSVQGFSIPADDDEAGGGAVNRIDLTRLDDEAFDYIALGDWHGMKEAGPRAWYAGTPELDRFPKGEGNQPGHVLLVTATRGGAVPVVRAVRTARFGWHREAAVFAGDADLAGLEQKVEVLLGSRAQQDLLLLELRGQLGIEATTRLEQAIEAWRARLLRLKLDHAVAVAPTPGEIEGLTQRAADPLISRVAAGLIARAGSEDEEGEAARLALRELHAACHSRR